MPDQEKTKEKSLEEILYKEFQKINIEKKIWTMPQNSPIQLPSEMSAYEKNIYLKENLYKEMDNNKFLEISFWIINSWGGIQLKNNELNNKRIQNFKIKLDNKNENLTKDEFSIISSLSKVASFYKPEDYVIYDSRVIYSLNWIIFKNSLDSDFFPQPTGRNTSMMEYDQRTIFNLSEKNVKYYSENVAYAEYCKLLRRIALKNNVKIYELEMFLFCIANTRIIDNIKNSLSVTFNRSIDL